MWLPRLDHGIPNTRPSSSKTRCIFKNTDKTRQCNKQIVKCFFGKRMAARTRPDNTSNQSTPTHSLLVTLLIIFRNAYTNVYIRIYLHLNSRLLHPSLFRKDYTLSQAMSTVWTILSPTPRCVVQTCSTQQYLMLQAVRTRPLPPQSINHARGISSTYARYNNNPLGTHPFTSM